MNSIGDLCAVFSRDKTKVSASGRQKQTLAPLQLTCYPKNKKRASGARFSTGQDLACLL